MDDQGFRSQGPRSTSNTQDPGSTTQDPGSKILDALDLGSRIQDGGFRNLAGSMMPRSWIQRPVTRTSDAADGCVSCINSILVFLQCEYPTMHKPFPES